MSWPVHSGRPCATPGRTPAARRPSSPRRAAPYLTGMFATAAGQVPYRLTVGGGWRDGWRGVVLPSARSRIRRPGLDARPWRSRLGRRRGLPLARTSAAPAPPTGAAPPASSRSRTGRRGRRRRRAGSAAAAACGLDVALITDAGQRPSSDTVRPPLPARPLRPRPRRRRRAPASARSTRSCRLAGASGCASCSCLGRSAGSAESPWAPILERSPRPCRGDGERRGHRSLG